MIYHVTIDNDQHHGLVYIRSSLIYLMRQTYNLSSPTPVLMLWKPDMDLMALRVHIILYLYPIKQVDLCQLKSICNIIKYNASLN